MPPVVDDYFHRTIFERETYPLPRFNRGEGLGPGALAIPRVQIFSFSLATNAASRTTRSFGRFKPPWMLREFQWSWFTGSRPTGNTLELGVAGSAVNEESFALTSFKAFQRIQSLVDAGAQVTADAGQGFPQHDLPSQDNWFGGRFDYLHLGTEEFLTVTHYRDAAGANFCTGWFTIVDGLDPQQLVNFR